MFDFGHYVWIINFIFFNGVIFMCVRARSLISIK